MQPPHAVYLEIVHRVSLLKCNKAFEQSETIAMPPIATHPCVAQLLLLLIHSKFRRIQIIFGKEHNGRRSRVILEASFAVAFACGGAYFAGDWGVVQSVGHLTVNEDGGGSNPPAPANFLRLCSRTASLGQSASRLRSSLASRRPSIPRWCNPFSADCRRRERTGNHLRNKEPIWCLYREPVARYRAR
jgi:hypothetical protein